MSERPRRRLRSTRASRSSPSSATAERFVLVTHEHPDGDALGSLVAMQAVLRALGKDSVIVISADEFPLPHEYRFFALDGLCTAAPAGPRPPHRDLPRLRQPRPQPAAPRCATPSRSLNIDHHHDNTRFGTINHVVAEASCTAEIVWDLMRGPRRRADAADRRGALRRPRHRHRPLLVREHDAARAPDGRRADRRRRRRRTRLPPALRGRAARQARAARARAGERRALRRRARDGRDADAPRTSRRPAPRTATPRASSTTCARSTARRSRRSSASRSGDSRGARKVSLRATDDEVDVSAIARALRRRRPPPGRRLLERPRDAASSSRAIRAQSLSVRGWEPRAIPVDGSPPRRQAGRADLARRRRARARRALGGAARRARRDARPVRDRPADRARRPRDAARALLHGAAEDLRGRRAARRALVDRRPGGRDRRDRGSSPDDARAAARRGPPAPAGLLGGQDRRRARLRAGAARRGRRDGRARGDRVRVRAALARGRPRRASDRLLVGHLRALAGRRPGGDAYCLELRRTRDRAVRGRRRLARGGARRADSRSPTRGGASARSSRSRARTLAPPRTAAPLEPRRTRGRRCCSSTPTGDAGRRGARARRPAARRGRTARRSVGFRGDDASLTPRADAAPAAAALAVGTFDGVHLGHREVIGRRRHGAHLRARTRRRSSRPRARRALLTPLPVKAELIAVARRRGAGRHPLRRRVRRAQRRALRRRGARRRGSARRAVSVGENFRFGARARGDAALLAADGRFDTRVVPLREVDGEIVSSSHIRSLIAAGEVAARRRACSAPRSSCAATSSPATAAGASSASRPRTSSRTRRSCCPATASTPASRATAVPAAVSIGVRPTFGTGRGELIEAYLIDFDGDLYGSELRLHFLERLRGERRFETRRGADRARCTTTSSTPADLRRGGLTAGSATVRRRR